MMFVTISLPDQAELHHNCDRFLVILGFFNYDMVLIGGNVIDIPIANIKLVDIFLYQHPIEWYKSVYGNIDVYVLDYLENIFLEGLDGVNLLMGKRFLMLKSIVPLEILMGDLVRNHKWWVVSGIMGRYVWFPAGVGNVFIGDKENNQWAIVSYAVFHCFHGILEYEMV